MKTLTNKNITFSIVPAIGFGKIKSNIEYTGVVEFNTDIYLFLFISIFFNKVYEYEV